MRLDQKMLLTGKKAVVTGGSMAIGLAVAQGLAELGADVAVFDIADGGVAMKTIEAAGRKGLYVKTDVTRVDEVDAAFARVEKEFGRVDLLFNNAGVFENKSPAEEKPFEEWRRVLGINLDAMFVVAQRAGRIMIRQGGGAIVNTASMSAHIVNIPQLQIAYNTSKAAVVHMTRTLAVEWAPHNIRVNSISPGYIHTEKVNPDKLTEEVRKLRYTLTPMGRMGRPDELAGAVAYLLSDAASFTTGHDLVIDGGYVCI